MFSPDYTIENADIFFSQTLYFEDWSLLDPAEKQSSLNMALTSVTQNMREDISAVAARYDETKFLEFLFMQAFYLSQSTDRIISSNGVLTIMKLAEDKKAEVEFIQPKPLSYLWPRAVEILQPVAVTPKLGRA